MKEKANVREGSTKESLCARARVWVRGLQRPREDGVVSERQDNEKREKWGKESRVLNRDKGKKKRRRVEWDHEEK